ncbi:MAG: hypothetical protein N3G78_14905, partial [Desulfobacterota bacterium]|nr:hypothetical protein [Thermodesulfobacteriota bacterium]
MCIRDRSITIWRMGGYDIRGEWVVGATACGWAWECPSAYRLPGGPLVRLMEGNSWPLGFAN